ncbi:MAG: sigma-E factor negative regulatory protein [Gammaproteobacteria bacterium]|nr:sigma-E factor negative regulatory protein [Gammaproteobacteria bacterium]
MKEILSAAIDSEASERDFGALLQECHANDEMRRAWGRYHLIGSVMRNDHVVFPRNAAADLVDRVSNAIADEPTCLAPQNRWASRHDSSAMNVVRLVAGLAVAASIGGIAVFTLQPNVAVGPAIVEFDTPQRMTRWQTQQPEMETDLNTLLVEHGEFTPASGLNGLMAYAKFVSYDTGQ